jgi:hypothetical protein
MDPYIKAMFDELESLVEPHLPRGMSARDRDGNLGAAVMLPMAIHHAHGPIPVDDVKDALSKELGTVRRFQGKGFNIAMEAVVTALDDEDVICVMENEDEEYALGLTPRWAARISEACDCDGA